MKLTSQPEIEAKIARLVDYFDGLADGEEILWIRIEADTGISMDVAGKGRDYARKALRRLKRPYESIPKEGIRLSSPETAMTIVNKGFTRIDGAVRVADRTQRQLQERHLEKMSPQDQQKMIVSAGFFGAVRAFAKQASAKLLRR